MPHLTVGTENDTDIEIYYEDHGSGQPVVLIHGDTLNPDSWERQESALLSAGYRVIRYDRRGFGASSRPTTGFDYDTFAADLSHASYACVDTWLTDFRGDLPNIDVPMLVVHGTEDRILPYEATAKRLPDLVPNVKLVPVEGGPHNVAWTHSEECNKALLEFLAEDAAGSADLGRDLAA